MTDSPRPSVLRRALVVSTVSLVGLIAAGEIGLRLFGFEYGEPDPVYAVWGNALDAEMEKGRGLHRIATGMLWEPRPGAVIPMTDRESVNPDAYRGPARSVEKPPGTVRVLTLGDSSSFGMKVTYEETYTHQLELDLRAAGLEVEAMAGGVIGYTIGQGLERLRRFADYEPDVVVFAFGAVNELYPAQGLPDRPKIAHHKGEEPDSRDGLRERSRFVQLAHWVRDDLLGGLEQERVEKYEDWVRAEQHAGGQGALDWPGTRRIAPEDFARYLDEMVAEIRSLGAEPVMVSMPREQAYEDKAPFCLKYTDELVAAAQRLDVPLADVRSHFKGDPRTLPNPGELFLDHFHPSPKGHRRLADVVSPLVLNALRQRAR